MSSTVILKTIQPKSYSALYSYVTASLPSLVSMSTAGAVTTFTFSGTLTTPQRSSFDSLISGYLDTVDNTTDLPVNVSVLNSTTILLPAQSVFTGQWEDVSTVAALRIVIKASTPSAVNGVSVQFGMLAQQVDTTRTYTYSTANSLFNLLTVRSGRYVRLVYTNGSTGQTAFSMAVFTCTSMDPPQSLVSDTVTDDTAVALTKSVLALRHDSGQYTAAAADERGNLRVRIPTTFRRVITSNSVPLMQIGFTYGLNTDITSQSTVGTGVAPTWSGGKAQLRSGTGVGASTLSTLRYCRCAYGDAMTIIFGCVFGTGVAGNTQLVGAGTASNGVFVGFNGASFGTLVRTNGVDTWTAATAFNTDRVDGTGNTGFLLDPTLGNTYAISYDTTGFGNIAFMVFDGQHYIRMHNVNMGNSSVTPGLANAQFPCTAMCQNTTSTSNVNLQVLGFSAFSDTGIVPKPSFERSIDVTRTLTGTQYTPFLCLRNKDVFNGLTNTSTVRLQNVNVAALFSGHTLANTIGNVTIGIIEAGTVLGATYVDVSTANSVVQTCTTTTSITGGRVLYAATVVDSQISIDLSLRDIVITPGYTLCIACKLSANSSYTVATTATWAEHQ